jgi:hypothetical protein
MEPQTYQIPESCRGVESYATAAFTFVALLLHLGCYIEVVTLYLVTQNGENSLFCPSYPPASWKLKIKKQSLP